MGHCDTGGGCGIRESLLPLKFRFILYNIFIDKIIDKKLNLIVNL